METDMVRNLIATLMLASALAANAGEQWLSLKGQDGIGKGQHIVFVTGEEYYRSEEGMAMFAKILSQRQGYDCSVLFAIDKASGTINPNKTDHIPGLHLLADAGLMVIFARFRELPDADMKHIVDFVNAGKPVIGIRNATHAFRYPKGSESPYASWSFRSSIWPGGFGQQILGDTWVSHYGKFQKEATLAQVTPGHRDHPVMQGVAESIFIRTDVNGVNKLKAEDQILLRGRVLSGPSPDDPPVTDKRKDTRMPLAWFKAYTAQSGKTGRSFCTTAGASVDWLSEDLRRLMVNAMLHLTGHEDRIPAKTNVDFVGDYQPKPFQNHSDDAWSKMALKPSDFGLSQ
jgi:hypothetical protein